MSPISAMSVAAMAARADRSLTLSVDLYQPGQSAQWRRADATAGQHMLITRVGN